MASVGGLDVLRRVRQRALSKGDAGARWLRELPDGRGCARLLAHDDTVSAMLLERLGPNLDELGMPLPRLVEAMATLQSLWQPIGDDVDLPTAVEKAAWLSESIVATWEQLGRPCRRDVVDRAVGYCDERAAAFDSGRAVLVHGDAHSWNTLDAGGGRFQTRRSRGCAFGAGPRPRGADARVQRAVACWRHLAPGA